MTRNSSNPKQRGQDEAIKLIKESELAPAIARECGITRQAVSLWTRVPAERVLVVERVTGIPRNTIRPDIYPPPRVRRVPKRSD